MFCTVVWKVAKGVLVEKIEKKTNCYVQKYILVLFVYEYQSNIVKYEEECTRTRNIIKTRREERINLKYLLNIYIIYICTIIKNKYKNR